MASRMMESRGNPSNRPHPRTPPSSGALKAAGPVAAAADKARDVVTDRGN
jgi:hypothetical protein